jgi:hypothetical protein
MPADAIMFETDLPASDVALPGPLRTAEADTRDLSPS